MNVRATSFTLALLASVALTPLDKLQAQGKEKSGKQKITAETVYQFCHPMPLGLVAKGSGINIDALWKELGTGKSSIAAVLKKKGVASGKTIAALKALHRKQIKYWTDKQGYSSKEIAALAKRTDEIAKHFVTEPFNIKFAREHIMMAATDWGDPKSAGTAMMKSIGGLLLDLKYKLDIYDDVRGGQHNFAPDAMSKSDIKLVHAFGKENREALLRVVNGASACGAVKYASWVKTIAECTFGADKLKSK